MEKLEDKVLRILRQDFEREREKYGKDTTKDVKGMLEEFRQEELSETELETLKNCYECECNESSGSLVGVLSVASVMLTAVGIFITIAMQDKEGFTLACAGGMYGVLIFLYMMYIDKKTKIISNDNTKFRNRIIAIKILLTEKEIARVEGICVK